MADILTDAQINATFDPERIRQSHIAANAEIERLKEKIDAYKCASLLITQAGDAADIEPEHIEKEISGLRNDVERLRRELADQQAVTQKVCAEIAGLTPDTKRYPSVVAMMTHHAQKSEQEKDAALAKLEVRTEALKRYGLHLATCGKSLPEDGGHPCTCGLDAALADDQPAPDGQPVMVFMECAICGGPVVWVAGHRVCRYCEMDYDAGKEPPSTDGDTLPEADTEEGPIVWRMDGEGFEVPSGQPYRIICCDCGLEHHIVLVSQDSRPIGVAAWRATDGDTQDESSGEDSGEPHPLSGQASTAATSSPLSPAERPPLGAVVRCIHCQQRTPVHGRVLYGSLFSPAVAEGIAEELLVAEWIGIPDTMAARDAVREALTKFISDAAHRAGKE